MKKGDFVASPLEIPQVKLQPNQSINSIEQKLNFITAKVGGIGEIGSKADIEEIKQVLMQLKDEQTNLK